MDPITTVPTYNEQVREALKESGALRHAIHTDNTFNVDLATVTRIGAGGSDSEVVIHPEIDLEGDIDHAD